MATEEVLCPLCGEGCTCDKPIPYELADTTPEPEPEVEPHACIRFTTSPDGRLNVKVSFEPEMDNRDGAENPLHVNAALAAFELFAAKFSEGGK